MTSAVTSSESAVGSRHSVKKRWSQQEATVHQQMILKLTIAKRCRLHKWIRQRFAFALRIQHMGFDTTTFWTFAKDQSLKLEKKSVDGITRMLKRNLQVHSFKCASRSIANDEGRAGYKKGFQDISSCKNSTLKMERIMAEIESCNCLKSREQDLYYSGK
ncbi:hypothetical protein F511_45949 [Dorcoceras hygrometricum]|uniref:Uncharacterized protein n=1 Tax=Dorcoceras hygrometricum TaxID=472368 RepID=A0A2Z7A252_9LAMI|nr:hypothetical protein F511_45949 [Dorcoceras hygrometricum]